jgi:hypothetical protein
MSVVSVTRVFGGNCTSDPISGKKETVIFRVVFNTPTYKIDALAATDGTTTVPQDLETHPSDSKLKVIARSVDDRTNALEGAGYVMDVSVTYGIPTVNFENNPDDTESNKWNRRVRGRGLPVTENTNKSLDGKPIKNSFGDIYPSEIPKTFYDEEIVVDFETNDIAAVIELLIPAQGEINSPQFTMNMPVRGGGTYPRTFPEYTVKLGAISYEDAVDSDGNLTWKVSVPLLYRSNVINEIEYGHRLTLVDKGRRWYAVDENDDPYEVYNPSGETKDLDGNGFKNADGADAVLLTDYQIDYLTDLGSILAEIES